MRKTLRYAWSKATVIVFAALVFCLTLTDSKAQFSNFIDVPPCAVGQGPQTGKLILIVPPGTTGGVAPYTYSINSGQTFDYIDNCFVDLSSGSYTVTTTDNASTAVSVDATVGAALPQIVVTANVTVAPTCTTNSATACASAVGGTGSFTFLWFLNGTQVATGPCPSNLAPGNYIVAAQENGCSCATSTNLLIETPTLIATGSTIDSEYPAPNCNGSVTLPLTNGTAPYAVHWTMGGLQDVTSSNNIITFNGVCPGSYQAIITDSNGCAGTLNTPAVVSLLGTNIVAGGEGMQSSVSLWPNPFRNELKYALPPTAKRIFITDTRGRIVHEQKVFFPNGQFDFSFLGEGIYLFNTELENGEVMGSKLVKVE